MSEREREGGGIEKAREQYPRAVYRHLSVDLFRHKLKVDKVTNSAEGS